MTTVSLVTGRLPAELQAPLRGVRSPTGTTCPGPQEGVRGPAGDTGLQGHIRGWSEALEVIKVADGLVMAWVFEVAGVVAGPP